ncbi:MAG TPA: hypothetical protein PKJ95_01525 [Atribacterota bacterium]|nr:hypothetical protein [Atribacterota bacterium]
MDSQINKTLDMIKLIVDIEINKAIEEIYTEVEELSESIASSVSKIANKSLLSTGEIINNEIENRRTIQ